MPPSKFYPNSGALFTVKDKKSDKAPDLSGNLCLGTDTVDYIIEQYNAGNPEITLDLSSWKKVSQGGNKFLSISVRKPFVKTGAPQRARSDDSSDPPF